MGRLYTSEFCFVLRDQVFMCQKQVFTHTHHAEAMKIYNNKKTGTKVNAHNTSVDGMEIRVVAAQAKTDDDDNDNDRQQTVDSNENEIYRK